MEKYNLDADHTAVCFSARHMMVTWVTGRFSKVSGTLFFDPLRVSEGSVEVEVGAASLSTGVDRRDEDLKSPNYFDAEKYPKILFRSSLVEYCGLDHCLVEGSLTLHGVTRPVTLDVRWAGPSHFRDETGNYTTYGFRASTRINREAFGMTRNLELVNGGFMVGKEIYLTIDAEADLVEA